MLAVALVAASCSDPQVPQAVSTDAELTLATAEIVPATPIPTPTPTVPPTPERGLPIATPLPVVQPGLSSELIRLAVIFDGETGGVADQLFFDAWLGAKAWEREVNINGGLGGRLVQVFPVDSGLFNHRAALLEQVCQGDFFAIVGSHSLGDFDGAEFLGSEGCNLADFPGQVYGSQRAASPVTFVANPFLNNIRQAGPALYLAEKYPEAALNLASFRYSDLDLASENERQREMAIAQGMEVVLELPVDLEEDFFSERVVGRWEDSEAQSIIWSADPGRLIKLLEALEERPVFALCEWGCYSQQFLIDGGEAVEGVYTWIAHSPFDSASARGDIGLYGYNMNTLFPDAGWSEVGLQSWMSGRLFEAAYTSLIEDEREAPTREQLIAKARDITFFTANGTLSPTNPGAGEPSPCFVLMVVRNGKWEQEHPVPPRDLDCDESNLYNLVSTASRGVTSISAATSSDEPVPEATPAPDLENPEPLEE